MPRELSEEPGRAVHHVCCSFGFFSPQKNFSTQLIIKVYGAIFTFSTDAAAVEGRQANTGLGAEGKVYNKPRKESLGETEKLPTQ